MEVEQNKTVELSDFVDFTISMHWTTYEDLDLLIVYEEEQQKRVIYFNNSGSKVSPPFISFQDIDFTSLDVENQESVEVAKMVVDKIWIFGWAFEYILESESLDFSENGLMLSISNTNDRFVSPVVSGVGNLCRLGQIERDSNDRIHFTNNSACFTVEPFAEIEEIFAYL